MSTPTPDAVKRLVDARDMTEMSDISDRVPSPADRKVFPSGEYKEEQRRPTASHQAKVEEKPKVSKAGGVYYTPTYIVDYIVKNTVGKLIAGKTPAETQEQTRG